jgi:hypothetical protein
MKQISSLFAAVLMTGFVSACGQDDAPAQPDLSAEGEVVLDAPSDSLQVGDRIGDNEAERKAAREKAIAERAAEQARKRAEAEARGVSEIGWEDLMPEGEEERLAQMYQSQMSMLYGGGGGIAEGSAADAMVQIGTFNTVPELNSKKVRIPGYTVPFEYGAKAEVTEFLLVPYFGACIHAPPPPPNQTLFVKADDPIALKDLAQAVWVEGVLTTQTQESDLADAAYTLQLTHIEKYEY